MNEFLTKEQENEKLFQLFKEKVFWTAEESIEYATVPLVHYKDGKAHEVRTGVLIQIDQSRFMVTAAHGLIEHHEAGRDLHIVMPEKGLQPIPLVNEKFWSTKNPNEDLSVTELSAYTVRELGTHYRGMRLDDMMSQNDRRHGEGLYLLMGYPRDMIIQDPDGAKQSRTWKYLTTIFEGKPVEGKGYTPDIHFLLDYQRRSFNKEGKRVYPEGLSGCGVWFAGNPISHSVFKASDFKLVAIQTSWSEAKQYVKSTWIDNVMHIIWKYYPDMRAAMMLHGIRFNTP